MLVKYVLMEHELKRIVAEALFSEYDQDKHDVRFHVQQSADSLDRPTGGYVVTCEATATADGDASTSDS